MTQEYQLVEKNWRWFWWKKFPLEGDEVVGGRLPDPDVAEHLIWGSEELWSSQGELGGSLNLCWSWSQSGRSWSWRRCCSPTCRWRGRPPRPGWSATASGRRRAAPTSAPSPLPPAAAWERPAHDPEFQSFDFSPLVPIVDVLQDCRGDPSKVWAARFVSRTIMLGGAFTSLIKFLSFNHFPARSQSSTAPHAQHCYGITSGGVDSHKLCFHVFFSNCQLDSQKEPEKGSKRAPKGLQNAQKALQKCSKRAPKGLLPVCMGSRSVMPSRSARLGVLNKLKKAWRNIIHLNRNIWSTKI